MLQTDSTPDVEYKNCLDSAHQQDHVDRLMQNEDREEERLNEKRQSERRRSLERISSQRSERRQSLERSDRHTSERRPSIERLNYQRSERRQSLERSDRHTSERRPSIERLNYQRSERRQSLERSDRHTSERRPSIERLNYQRSERRQSLERSDKYKSESGPNLEWSERNNKEGNSGQSGISTLRPQPLNERGVPGNWDLLLPVEDDQRFHLVPLSTIDWEYSAITVDFEEAGLRVKCVERLQNRMLLDRFRSEKDHLKNSRSVSEKDLNECYLYHGTQANKLDLCEEGLDSRLSFQGCFGRGIYFSDNPRKCIQYAKTNDDRGKHAMILVCRVILGDSKVYPRGEMDPDLRREPERLQRKGGWRYYDSVQGIPNDYPEFVVYENRRAMIEYVVTYEEAPPQPLPSDQPICQDPSAGLYKEDLESIELPISEEELDRLYLLTPDSDSDASCDEHTREVERLRDNVRRNKAKQLGIPYKPPTEEQKRYDRLHWKRVCYYSCPPNSPLFDMMIKKKREEKDERKRRKQAKKDKKPETTGSIKAPSGTSSWKMYGSAEEEKVENDSVAEVLSNLIAEFLTITTSEDVSTARRYIMENGMDLEKALCQYFTES
ncbi:hypothetical protein C0Q70_09746 [Pomacea canaliculata]|uniref:Poly [ADP-ribose] polymerase n=1 Tax=Pomacea canaliculata TaxID=400727 RepID=A0A2T7PAN0_POMCA|nr:uncharacterized protein LOC112563587 isoform X2 [Pomacea canaliculata]PVD30480.1 hypothetical protein C0Q70_09746 [Pomacea canaliculata]